MRSPRPTEAPLVVPSNLGQSLSHGCAVPAPVVVPKILCSLNAHRILTTATPFCSLLPPLAALANVPLYTREPLGTGDADRRNQRPKFWDKIWLAVATPQARRPCGPPRNDNGFLSFRGAERRGNPSFLRWTGVRAAVPGAWPPPTKFRAEIWGVSHRHRPLRVVAESCHDHPGSALSAERGAGQIRFLPDNLRVQHGVPCPEVCGKPRPCPHRDYLN